MLRVEVLQRTQRLAMVTLPEVRLQVHRVERAVDVLVTFVVELATPGEGKGFIGLGDVDLKRIDK